MSEYKKQLISTEAKVGFFSLIILVILIFVSIKLTGWKWGERKGYYLYAFFDNVEGLSRESPVVIAGIKIGKVVDISLVNDRAKVKIKIFDKNRVTSDAQAIIRTRGILGEKYIEIKNGSSAVFLENGDTIKKTLSPPDFEKMINEMSVITVKLEEIVSSLSGVLGGKENKQKLSEIVENIRVSTEEFKTTIADLKAKVDYLYSGLRPSIKNIRAVTGILKESLPGMVEKYNNMMKQLGEVVENSSKNIDSSIKQLKEAMNEFAPALEDLRNILKKMREGKGTIGKLLTDETTITKLNSSIDKVDKLLKKVEDIQVKIDYQGEYQIKRDEGWKSYLNFEIYPDRSKSYIFGIVNDPVGRETWREEEIVTVSGNQTTRRVVKEKVREDKLKVNIEYARHFGDFTVRGGIIQNSGGVGFDYTFLNNHAMMSLEGFDFGRKTNPYLRFRLAIWPWKYFYIVGGSSDFINYQASPIYFLGAGINFTDSDLKYIFSFVPSVGVSK